MPGQERFFSTTMAAFLSPSIGLDHMSRTHDHDHFTLMQSFSAAHRHESPLSIRQRNENLQAHREHLRTVVEMTTVMIGEDEICQEIEGLVARHPHGFCILTHANAYAHVGSRRVIQRIRHGESLLDMLATLKEQWSDVFPLHTMVGVYYVEPQPLPFQTGGMDCLHVLLDFDTENHRIPNLVVITQAYHDGYEDEPYFLTVRLPAVYTDLMIFEAADVIETCEQPYVRCECTFGIFVCPRNIPAFNRHGLAFQVKVVHLQSMCFEQMMAEDTHDALFDEASLMTMQQTQVFRNRNAVYVYRLGTEEPIFIQTSEYDGSQVREHIMACLGRARAHEGTRYQNSLLHLVHPMPDDLQPHNLDAYIQEAQEEKVAGKVIILLDVEIYDNTKPAARRPSDEWREVRYVEKVTSRTSFLAEIGAAIFCQEDDRCLLHAGGQPWRKQDLNRKELANGIYIVLRMPNLRPEIPFCQQWQQAEQNINVQSMQMLRPPQRSTARRNSATSSESSDSTTLIQLRHEVFRPSFLISAQEKLQPPGNGSKVMFDPRVQFRAEEGDGFLMDKTISNRFILDFSEGLRFESEKNRFVSSFRNDIRYQQIHHDEHAAKRCEIRLDDLIAPRSEPIEIRLDDLIPLDLSFLPIDSAANHSSVDPALPACVLPTVSPEAVPIENPQEMHVHDSFEEKLIACPGIEQLFDRITQTGNIILQREIPMKEQLDQQWIDFLPMLADDHDAFDHVAIYTDGSKLWSVQKSKEVAAWGCTFYGQKADGSWRFLGCLAHEVILDRDDPGCTGALESDNDCAEGEAIIWAVLWALQSKYVANRASVEIVSDSLGKVRCCQGTWNSKSNPQHYVLHSLVCALQQLTPLRFEWTKAHSGDPYNEITDHVAKTAARYCDECDWLVNDYYLMEFGDALPWIWAIFRCKHHADCPRKEGDHLAFKVPAPFATHEQDHGDQSQPKKIENELRLHLASFNTHSLKTKTRGLQREEIIFRIAKMKKISVLALQETRRRVQKQWQKEDFFIFSTAADRGQGGIDLIFNKREPYMGQGQKARFFSAADFMIMLADNQSLAVRMKTQEIELVFVACHAPHDMAPNSQKQVFWEKIKAGLKNVTAPVFVLIDANAKLGHEKTSFVGDAHAEMPNENTAYFTNFLENLELFVPSTFEQCVAEPHLPQGTWYHKGGAPGSLSRLDYICVPAQWATSNCEHFVQDVELARDHKDHRMVLLKLKAHILVKEVENTKKVKPDRNMMATIEGQRIIQEEAERYNSGIDLRVPVNSDEVLTRYSQFVSAKALQHFPKAKAKYRPTWIDESTLDDLHMLKRLRRYVHQSRVIQRRAFMRQILLSWKDSKHPKPGNEWLKQTLSNRAWAEHQIETFSKQVRSNLRKAEAMFLTRCAEKFEERSAQAAGEQLWKVLKFELPKFKEKCRNKSLRYVKTYEGLEKHFAATEDAVSMTIDQLQGVLADRSRKALSKMKAMDFLIEHVPTLREFEAALRHVKKGKTGFGEVWPEWLRADPRQAALALFPVFSSFFIFAQQPPSLKGGSYYPLYKGKGSQSDVTSFRAILLSSFISKAITHVLRQRMLGFTHNILQGMQIGGMPGQRTQYGVQALHLMRTSPNDRGINHATLFFDLRAAFYRTTRSCVVDDVLGYYDSALDEEVSILASLEQSECEKAKMPEQLRAATQESLSCSWFNLATAGIDLQECWIPTRGTRPGDPAADISFSFAMTSILQNFMKDTANDRPVLVKADGTQTTVPPVTWVGDVSLTVEDPCPFELMKKTQRVLASMHQRTKEVGLELNLQPGKTEAIMKFQGPKSAVAHRHLRVELGGMLSFGEADGEVLQVHTTNKYTHLGSVQSMSLLSQAEIAKRVGKAGEAFRSIKRKVLANEALKPERRCSLAQVLIFSRLLHNAETWPALHPKHEKKLHSFMMKVFRTVARLVSRNEDLKHSTLEVQASIICMEPEWLIRLQRMRYFRHILHEAPPLLLELIRRQDQENPVSWLQMVRNDIEWLCSSLDLAKSPTEGDGIYQWWQRAANLGEAWDAMALKATKKLAVEKHMMAKQKWNSSKGDYLTSRLTDRQGLACQICHAVFFSEAALAVHLHRRHLVFPQERSYIDSTVCCSCLKQFHSMQRIRQHLQYAVKCKEHLQQVFIPHEAVSVQDQVQAGVDYRIPCHRVPGPRLPSRQEWADAAPWKVFHMPVQDDSALKACLRLCHDAAESHEQPFSLREFDDP